MSSRRHSFRTGQVVGERFTIEEFLGAGGMGEVYSAMDGILRQHVALKTIREEVASDPQVAARLKREVQLARRVSSPNVCRLHEIGVHESENGQEQLFFTMELIKGQTLREHLKVKPMALAEAEGIVEQVVSGLAALHAGGVLHRDLKSTNVMLVPRENGYRAVITDFGLAREQNGVEATLSAVGSVAGTPAYMSPEQMQGQSLTFASDVYALGVMMFEMVSGRLPFEGQTPLALALARMQAAAPSPRAFVPNLPERWEQTILSCLELDPKQRPALEDVIPLLKGHQQPRRASRRWLVAAIPGTLAAAGAAVWSFLPRTAANPEIDRRLKLGDEFAKRRTKEDLGHAIEEYAAVLAADPKNARAWAGQADAYSALSNHGFMDPREALLRARDAAMRAVELQDSSARSHGVLGYIISIHLEQWKDAAPHFQRAVARDPREPMVRLWYGAFLGKSGRADQAVEQLRAGLVVDPAHYLLNHQLAMELFCGRRFSEFHEQMRQVLRLHPFEAGSHLMMARALEWRGQFDEALRECEEGMKYRNSPSALCVKGSVEASRGNHREARRIAAEVERYWRANPFETQLLVALYSRIGDKKKAVEVLEEGFRRFDNSLLRVPTSPYSEGLDAEPGYLRFLSAIGWPLTAEKGSG